MARATDVRRKTGDHNSLKAGLHISLSNDEEVQEPTPIPIRIVNSLPQDNDTAQPEAVASEPTSDTVNKSDDFYPAWDKFIVAQPRRAKRAQRAAKALDEEKKQVELHQPDGLQFKVNAAQSWEDAANECKLKVAAIVEECKRLNQKYRDALFDLADYQDCLQGLIGEEDYYGRPSGIKRVHDIFDKPQFYIDGESAADIHQGNLGNCWFLSALTSVSADRAILDRLCVAKDETVGVYGFVFYRDGEWVHEVIDDKLYINVGDGDNIQIRKMGFDGDSYVRHDEDKLKEQLQKGGEALYFSHSKSNETWVPLIEKAYAKAHGDYTSISGGWPSEGIEDVTGGVATSIDPEDIMDRNKFWTEQLRQVNKKYLFNCATGHTWHTWGKGLASSHAYTVLDTFEEGDLKLIKVRNPWGEFEWSGDWSDGAKQWTPEMMKKLNHTFGDDGIFWISYKDLFKNFPSLHRVRLFNHEWQISQRWTCVSVPWTVDYMDTKFEIDVSTKGPIVIVLAQPDERYFRGLMGRYVYALHFRLYRAGETGHRYLVRSMHSSGDEQTETRSVSAELDDIEPGKYFVIFKVIGTRNDDDQRREEAIVEYATERKEKLTAVGRRFDYAQTKGNLRAMEKSERQRQRTEMYEKAIKGMKRLRKNNKLERQRGRLRKKRRQAAITAQRKAIFERAAERRKAAKAEQEKLKKDAVISTNPAASSAVDSSEASQAVSAPSSSNTIPSDKTDGLDVQAVPATELVGSSAKETTIEQTADHVAKLSLEPEAVKEVADVQPLDSAAPTALTADTNNDPKQALAPVEQAEPQWEDPPEEADELEDDDFSWDSDMDGPLNSDASSRTTEAGKDIDIFADDAWNALCVVGLRVYSKGDVKIEVKTATEEAEDDVEVV